MREEVAAMADVAVLLAERAGLSASAVSSVAALRFPAQEGL
jgi:hypothetical protein